MNRKNISPSLFLENFSNQHRTPISDINALIAKQRPKYQHYFYHGYEDGQRYFYSGKELAELRFLEEIKNSRLKRKKHSRK